METLKISNCSDNSDDIDSGLEFIHENVNKNIDRAFGAFNPFKDLCKDRASSFFVRRGEAKRNSDSFEIQPLKRTREQEQAPRLKGPNYEPKKFLFGAASLKSG
jgi:hypothetical protein